MAQFILDRLWEQNVRVFPNFIMHQTMVFLSLYNTRLEIILDPVQRAKTLKKYKEQPCKPTCKHFPQKLLQNHGSSKHTHKHAQKAACNDERNGRDSDITKNSV